jgi:hypothetical protein
MSLAGYRPAWTTWIYLALAGVVAVLEWLLFFNQALGLSPDAVREVRDVLMAFIYLPVFAAGAWIYQTWSRVEDRPAGALGRFFIPAYNLYWLFACPQHICSSIDRALVEAGQPGGAPRTLATVAPTLQVGMTLLGLTELRAYLLLFSPATHVVWLAFMVMCDRAVVRAQAVRT